MAQRGLQEFSFTFSGAGEQSIQVEGDWCQVHEADAAGVGLRFDDGKRGTWYEGQGRRIHYKRIHVYSSIAQSLTLLLGFGHATDARAVVNANVSTTIEPGNTFDNGGDVAIAGTTTAALIAADADRLYALVKNPSSNTDSIRVGGAGVGAATGVEVEPGETLPVATVAAIYAYNPKATAQTVSVVGIKRV